MNKIDAIKEDLNKGGMSFGEIAKKHKVRPYIVMDIYKVFLPSDPKFYIIKEK